MKGKVCLITGATDGHGKACARLLALKGADVIILGRNPAKCEKVQAEIENECGKKPDILVCDLSLKHKVREAAEEFLSWKRPLHVLINNAGIVNQKRRETADGIEETFAVNYLAQFHLTLRLLERLRETSPARIINVSSDMHRMFKLDFNNLELHRGYSWMKAYGSSKRAVIYFTLELAGRLTGKGVTVNAVDPGPVASNITGNTPGIIGKIASFIIKNTFPSPEKAARTTMYLATSHEIEGLNGTYYRFMKEQKPSINGTYQGDISRLWALSLALTGLPDISL